jgi:ABC-2 type transport system permease protein
MGKAVAWAAIALISLVGCFAFAMLVFGVRVQGSWLGFVGVLLATSLLASTLGLALAAVGRTPAGTRGFAIGFILLMVMIGGAWFPSFVFPKWLQTVSLAVPTRWAMDGLNAMTWRGLGLEAALLPIGVLVAFSALFAAITWKWFKWEA